MDARRPGLLGRLLSQAFLRPLSCAGVLYLLAQWTGISTMVFYMTNIFQESGSSFDPLLAPVLVAGIRVLTAAIASLVLSFASRRHLFVISSLLICFSSGGIATFSYMRTSDCCLTASLRDSLGLLPLLATIAMFTGHALGVVPVCQLLAAEVFPTETRTLGSGICVAIATIANAINAKVFPSLLSLLGFHGTFWLYSTVGIMRLKIIMRMLVIMRIIITMRMIIIMRTMTVMAMTILVILTLTMICFDTGWFSDGNDDTGNYDLLIISNDGMAMILFPMMTWQ